MRRVFTHRRTIVVGCVAAFLAAFFAIGAISKSTPATVGVTAATAVPYAPWYWTMAVSPSDPNIVLLGTSNGVYRSGDGAKTWRQVGPRGVNTTSLVAAGNAIFMGGVPGPNPVIRKGKGRTAPDGPAVLAESTDGGKTWHLALNSKVMFGPVAWAQKQSKIAYAVGFDRSFWRSDDGGQTWKQVS